MANETVNVDASALRAYADQAEADAIATAASDATTKANAAQAAAIAAAATDATTKANAAQAAAIAAAATDATTKANAAQTAAASDATTKANTAEANAIASANAHSDNLVVGLFDDRGNFDASGNLWPASGGSGTAGAILKGDVWRISVAGTLGGELVDAGDSIRALTDTPGQTAGNWALFAANTQQATESVRGTVAIATQAEAQDQASTNDIDAVTPKKWWQAFTSAFTTVGRALSSLTNPSAISFLRINADNSVTARDASGMRSDLGLGTLATQSGTFSGTSSGTNTGDQTSVSGNAGTATALQNARTIQINLASGSSASFDGTANVTPGVTGVLPIANGGMDTRMYYNLSRATWNMFATQVAGTYFMGGAAGSATNTTSGNATTLQPNGLIHIAAADFPTVNGLAPKLRIRANLFTNHTAPTGNFTFGLYPITSPASAGGAGVHSWTIGTLVSGSNGATVSTPAADTGYNLVGSDFALPADGWYAICVVTTATVATNSMVQMNADLQIHNA